MMSRLLSACLISISLLLAGCGNSGTVIERIDDAAHARVGVMTGTTGEAIAMERLPEADIKSFDDIMDAVAALKSGQLDALITGYPAAVHVSGKNPELRMLDEPLSHEDTAIALRREDTALQAKLDVLIAELKQDGTLEDMKRRWFKTTPGPYEEPHIAIPETGEVLRIGVSATREPFNFVDQDGRVTGHDGELARIIGARLQRPIEFSNMKFMALIPALQSGKVDIIVTGMTATEERKKQVSFTRPYFANAQVMLVRNHAASANPATQATPAITDTESLADKRIGVLMGTVHDRYASSTYPQATLLQYQTTADVVLALKSGKVDAALFDEEPLRVILRTEPTLTGIGERVLPSPLGAGFRKGSPLKAEFNSMLASLKQSGEYDDMVERWIKRGETVMPEIPVNGNSGVLVVATSNDGLPFGAIKDNRPVGFDIELVSRFAAKQDKTLQIATMDFGSLVAAAASGKADIIISSIYITEERLKQIDFSDPYFHTGSRFAARQTSAASPATATSEAVPGFLASVTESFESNILHEKRYLLIWDGLKTTIVISVLATLFGTLLGALVCAMRMSPRTLLNLPARIYINVLRGMPVLVLLMLIFYVVFASVNISPVLVAVIAFGMNFGAYVAEIYRAGIQSIDRGQTEAGISMGFTRLQTFLYIIMPQTIQRILPVYKGEFISLVKMTSIVGYIAVQDLTKASDIIRSRTFDAFFPLVMVAILYFLISWTLMLGLEYLERRTDPKYRRRKVVRA